MDKDKKTIDFVLQTVTTFLRLLGQLQGDSKN